MAGPLPARGYLKGVKKPVRPVLDPTHPLSRGLVGCWLLGESTGQAADISGNGNHGPYVNTPTVISSHHGGTATKPSGSAEAVSIPNSATLNPAQLTVGGFFRVTGGAGTTRCAIAKRDASAGDFRTFYLAARNGNTWGFYFTQGNANYKGTDGTIAVGSNVWQHVVATYDGATIRVFVDGAAGGTAAATGAPDTTTVATLIGAISSEAFVGDIEGVRFYNRALTVSEIYAWKAEPYAGIYSAGAFNFVGAAAAPGSFNPSWAMGATRTIGGIF